MKFACARPDEIIAAAAEVYGQPASLVVAGKHGEKLALARALAVRLGTLEGYSTRFMAAALGRGRTPGYALWALEIPGDAVRAARTLIRDPGLRSGLPATIVRPVPRRRPKPAGKKVAPPAGATAAPASGARA